MTINNIEQTICQFLESDTPEVICLNGNLGVGKTHLWNKCWESYKRENVRNISYYSKVSLYGLKSLEDLKISLVLKQEKLLDENNNRWKRFTKSLTFAKGVVDKNKDVLSKVLGNSKIELLSTIGFNTINEQIICLDDVERKQNSLTMAEVLSLAFFLKDEKKCKVILIFNNDLLGKSDLQELNKHYEKTINYKVILELTPEEAASIALKSDDFEQSIIKESVQKLKVNNIRIIQQIEQHIQRLLEHVPRNKFHPDLIRQVIQTYALYYCSYYGGSSFIPHIEYIKRYNLTAKYNILNKKEQNWYKLLSEYGYTGTDELDLEIEAFIIKGYPQKSFAVLIEKQNLTAEYINAQKEYYRSWELYHNSLQENQQEVLDSLYITFKKAVKKISPTNLNGTVELFQELDDRLRAQELIDYYIQERSDEPALFNPFKNTFPSRKPVKEVAEAFMQKHQSTTLSNPKSFNTLMHEAIEGKINIKEFEPILIEAPVEIYYKFYKSLHNVDIRKCIDVCFRYKDHDDIRKNIYRKAVKALNKLAEECLINKIRLKDYIDNTYNHNVFS